MLETGQRLELHAQRDVVRSLSLHRDVRARGLENPPERELPFF